MAQAAAKQPPAEALPSWNLTDFYPGIDDPAVAADLASARDETAAFAKRYEGKVAGLSGDALATAISEYERVAERQGKLSSYADLVFAGDMSKPEHGAFYQNINEAMSEFSSALLFFTLDLNKLSDGEMAEKLKSAKLQHYASWLRDLRTYKPYQLSDELEKLLTEKSVTGRGSWVRLFDESLAGLRFPFGNKLLTCDEAFNLLSNKSAATRKNAAKIIGEVLKDNAKLFALITNTLAKDKQIEDRWRGFAQPISSRNVSNQVEDEVVEALVGSVKASYRKLSHRYYRYKAKLLKMKQMNYWDRNAPLPGGDDSQYSWGEARELVLSAYASFSPKLAEHGKQFFDKRWIDAQVRPGKASGAFAHPTVPSVHPYILQSFHGKARDVMTLAHELGHGVHQVLAAKQGALMADTPLTLAETASVFGEQLTFRELLKREGDTKRRKRLIAHKVEDMLNTVVRQVAFLEYERLVHEERKQGEVPLERLGEIWLGVQKESLGPAFKFDKEYRNYWSYIPHFIHSPFYVYAYAFGDLLVNALYAQYLDGLPKFEEKYFAMLEAGGTLRHKELLAPFGLDASKPDFWQKGLSVIEGFIDELEA